MLPSAMSPRRSMAVLAFSASMPKESMVCAALARSSMPKGVLAAFSRSCATYSTPFASSPSMTEKLVWYASICALYLMAAVATCPSPCVSLAKANAPTSFPPRSASPEVKLLDEKISFTCVPSFSRSLFASFDPFSIPDLSISVSKISVPSTGIFIASHPANDLRRVLSLFQRAGDFLSHGFFPCVCRLP